MFKTPFYDIHWVRNFFPPSKHKVKDAKKTGLSDFAENPKSEKMEAPTVSSLSK